MVSMWRSMQGISDPQDPEGVAPEGAGTVGDFMGYTVQSVCPLSAASSPI